MFSQVKETGRHKSMMKFAYLMGVAFAFAPMITLADTITLTPEQVEAAKEAGASRNAKSAALGLEPQGDRTVHGEMGVAIGTGGYRSMYGTAIVPLGERTTLGLPFENEQYGTRYGRDRRGY